MVAGPCGSTRGIDELVIDRVEVVGEKRKYRAWTDADKKKWAQGPKVDSKRFVGPGDGVVAIRALFNALHKRCVGPEH